MLAISSYIYNHNTQLVGKNESKIDIGQGIFGSAILYSPLAQEELAQGSCCYVMNTALAKCPFIFSA